jgi:hypothetical protein
MRVGSDPEDIRGCLEPDDWSFQCRELIRTCKLELYLTSECLQMR